MLYSVSVSMLTWKECALVTTNSTLFFFFNMPFALLSTSTDVKTVVVVHVKLQLLDIKHVMRLT